MATLPVSFLQRWRPARTVPHLLIESPGAAALLRDGCGRTHRPAPLPERFLRMRAVCLSRVYRVTVDRETGRPVLTNPLTGKAFWPFPPVHKRFGDFASFGIMAAVLGDPASAAPGQCRILLYCEDGTFHTCVSGAGATWDTKRWPQHEEPPVQLAVAGGRANALLSGGDLLMFDFMLSFHHCRIRVAERHKPSRASPSSPCPCSSTAGSCSRCTASSCRRRRSRQARTLRSNSQSTCW
ncbi:hypothetical protein E2562_025720 [Oryza meyeriana var. granulata]|uniref:Uncharacterized protein n=1 Tax=Oryza meyeriana var. granulata TaxID=110450 RepID=A0A6G1CU69_9ORYZ|nr:hypothetical protein E2562_025720 [Oryza meyeriana var. granulata]